MKKSIYTIVLLLATVFGSLHATDIKFDGKQKLYFNSAPSWISYWNADGAVFSAYFYGPDGDKFAGQAKKIDGNIYAVIVPKGTWNHVIFTRHAPGTTKFNFNTADGFWTESRPLDLKQYQWDNYISNFNVKDDGSEPYCIWNQLYSEQPKNGKTPASLASDWGLTIENIAVCDNSTGDPFTLTPSTIDLGNGKYKYNYDMRAHAWFKTTDNGATWTNVDGKAGVRASADEGGINCNTELVGAAGSNTYYYLYAKEAEDQRLIRVSVDKDCDITCEITSFEVVPTAVNVGDNTYTMDGVVAFTKAEGNLIVECDGLSTVITSPVSPQRFSLEGLTADGNPEDFHAYFSSMGSCEMHRAATAPVPTSDATTHPVTYTTPKESTTLTPSSDGSDPWEWTLLGDPTILKNSGSNTFDAPFTMVDHDETLTYVYTEYNPTPTLAGNLIDNGSFEDVSVPFKWYTEYKNSNVLNGNKIWDGSKPDQKDIYDLATFKGTYGYFGVTNNANTYWKLMSHVAPKDGGFMAVIDGDEIADKQAWYAATADNANLQLVRGTSYLFSFWVANINNFGELINNGRRNCAILQFHIKCHSVEDGKWYEADLGEPIDLNDPKYMDFNWHQNSSTFSTRAYFNKDFDADDVTISVVDKNNKGLTIGNDFALDDIQFRAISIVSKSIKAREFFTVNIYEKPVTVDPPVISILQTPACGKTDFTMKVTVNYSTLNNKFTPITLQLTDNIYGDLFATPVVLDPAVNPNSITFTLSSSAYPMLVADGKVHTLTAKITRLDGAGVDKGGQNSSTYTSPGIPAIKTPVLTELNKNCDKTTYDLQVATEYVAFSGTKLHYEWDGAEWTDAVNPSLSYKELTPQTATGKLQNLPADGKTHTLRVYSDNALDCDVTITHTSPFSPAINKIDLGTPDYTCGVAQYQLELTIDYTNGLGRKIFVKEGTTELAQFVTENDADKHQKKVTVKLNFDVAHNLNIFFEGLETDCPHNKSVAAVAKPSLGTISYDYKTACDQTTFDLDVEIKNFINQDGKLTISIDGKTVTSTDFTPNSATLQTQKLTVTGLNADGNDAGHILDVAFVGGSHGCSDSKTLTGVPKTPKIGEVTHKITQGGCNTKTYDLEISVPFENPNGNLVVTDGGSLTQTILEANLSSSPAKFTFPGIISAGGSKTFQVYFTSASDCKHPVTFTEPTRPVIGVINTTPDPASCDQTTFTLKGNVSFEFGAGTLVITDVESGKFQSIPAGSWASPQNFTISGIPADDKTHTVNVKFDGDDASCPGVDKTYTAPYSPAINKIDLGTPDYTCGVAQYQLELTIDYTNGLGRKIFVKEGTTELAQFVTENDADKHQKKVTVKLNFDVAHNLNIFFEGLETDCPHNKSVAAVAKPSLGTISYNYKTACDQTTFDLDVEIKNFINQDGTLTVSIDGKTVTSTDFTPNSASKQTQKLTVTGLNADGNNTSHVLSVAFDGSHGCSDTKTLTGVPKTPKIGEVTHKITQGKCNTKTYDLEISVPFENPNGNLVVTDGGSLTQTILEANLSSSPAKFTFPGIISAGGSKTFQVYFTSASDCKHPVTFTEPTRPVIGVINTTPDPASCDQTTFTLKGNVSFEFGAGNLVITDVESGKFQSIPAGSWASPQNFTISGIPADGKTHTVNVKFDGDDASCPGVDKTYTAPYSPAISSTTAVPQDYACGDATYQVVVTVNYANMQDHDLVITDEAGHEKTLKATDAEYGAASASWTFDMPWVNPAVSHTFKAYFVGAESCKDEASHLGTYTTPIELKIDSVIVTPNKTDLLCDESSYTADVAIYLPFVATGKSIVLSYEGKSKTVPVNGNPTTTTLTMTTTDQKGVTISADFSDATNTCAILSHAFDTPKKWTCDKDTAHICVGGSYNWHNNDYAPATEGLHKFRDNYDSLFLFVHAEPTVTMLPAEIICESENEIRLPFVIKSGTPNNFDIAVNGHNFTQAMNNDTIVLSRPSDIAAGTYTATITVRDSLVSCFTTTQVRFSVAKADIMYRKWEDVIFIDNSSSLFTAYQWFETTRGELGGETKQYLHNPTGLPGIYFCRMITTAGDTLYTCASTFEDITRSRDVTGTATQQISVSPTYVRANGGIIVSQTAERQLTIMLYDATGKMTHRFTQSDAIGTIEAPEQVGVYVIRVTDGEVTQTAKIVVHE